MMRSNFQGSSSQTEKMWWIKQLGKTTEGLDTFGRTLRRHKFSPRRSPRVWTRAEDAACLSLQHFRGAEHHSANEELLNTKKMQEVELLIHLMTCNKHQLLSGCMSLFRNTTLIFLNTAFIILAAQYFIYSCVVMYEEPSLDSLIGELVIFWHFIFKRNQELCSIFPAWGLHVLLWDLYNCLHASAGCECLWLLINIPIEAMERRLYIAKRSAIRH